MISNGGQVTDNSGAVGVNPGSTNNSVLVTGTGSAWSNSSRLYIGYSGAGNSMAIRNGGLVTGGLDQSASTLGYNSSSSNNTVLVADTGSVWNNRSSLYVGYSGAANNMAIEGSGQVINLTAYLGYNSGSSNNSVRLTGGAVWRNNAVYIGYQGSSNSLVVTGGSVSATGLTVGFASADCNNVAHLDSGGVIVTNAAHNATLEVRRGKFVLNGGTLQVDRFVMTNACAQFIRTGGTLIYGVALLDPNRDDDGDGMANGWEQAYGLDPLNVADAIADNDGDGFTNLQELQAGTDPTNSSSAFRVLSLESTNNDILVTWQAGGGCTNVVQSAPDLTGSFSNVSPNIILTNTPGDVTTNYLDTGAATNGATRFYRMRLVP